MKTNDYEKAEEQSYQGYETSELRITYGEPNEWLAHKAGFRDGYQLGKAHAVRESFGDVLSGGDAHLIPISRPQAAAMAMQGLLSSNIWMKGIMREADPNSHSVDDSDVIPLLANRAVALADALLTELNKENNDTNSNK